MSDKVQNLRPFYDLGGFIKTKPLSRSAECLKSKTKYIHYGDIHGKYNGFVNDKSNIPYIEDINDYDFLSEGDLVFADASEDYIDLGKTILIENTDGGRIISGLHTHAFRPNFDFVNPTYLKYYTESEQYKREMTKRGQGISVLGISKKELLKIEANFHTRALQDKYAIGLRSIDLKIHLIEEKIESLKLFKKGFVQNELDKYKKKYDIEQISLHIKNKVKGGSPIYNENGENILLTNEYLMENDKQTFVDNKNDVSINDVLLLWDGSNAGTAYTNVKGVCGSTFTKLELKKSLSNYYLVENIMRDINMIKSIREGSGIPHVPKDFISYYKIPIPKIDEQLKFIEVTNKLDGKSKLMNEKLKTLKEFKKGLLQQMFV